MRRLLFAAIATVCLASLAQAQAAAKSLYERLGGQTAIVAMVDDFVGNIAKDKRINGFFAKSDPIRVKAMLVDQFCAGTGGPCTYTGKDMKSAHAGRGIAGKDFSALMENLGKTLKKLKVPKQEQGEIFAILRPMKKDIVEKK